VCTENLNPDVLMMKSAEDGRRYDAAHALDGTMDWCVLVKRPMCCVYRKLDSAILVVKAPENWV
jgi:hypothetical protein